MTLLFAASFLWAASVPLVSLIIPGVFLVTPFTHGMCKWFRGVNIFEYFSYAAILSAAINILCLLVLAVLKINSIYYVALLAVATVAWLVFGRPWRGAKISNHRITIIALAVAAYILFGFLFVKLDNALPTGDSQKAIYWAAEINTTRGLPNYQASVANLNRDPVDFYTPGLHVWTAVLMKISSQPLVTVGFMAIAMALALAFIGAALAAIILPGNSVIWPLLASFFLLTNYRFLRYLNEPGYHLQNIAGELLLFGAMLTAVSLIKKWHWSQVAVGSVTLAALFFTHQFSAFIAAFVLLPAVIILAAINFTRINWRRFGVVPVLVGAAGLGTAWSLGLFAKLPHLFNAQPHLLSQTPDWLDYPSLLGLPWLAICLTGVILLGVTGFRRRSALPIYIAAACLVLLALSQAPRWYVDIPPVRALFYIVLPFSVAGTAAIFLLVKKLPGKILPATMMLALFLAGLNAAANAFNFSHSTRTNSTLTHDINSILSELKALPGNRAVLTDDYNQRSTSWLLLAEHPSYARTASDIATLMAESGQSAQRYQLYLNQLDFEKIFNLASWTEVQPLMRKHNIGWVTGIKGANDSGLAQNIALTPTISAGAVTLFESLSMSKDFDCADGWSVCAWVVKPSTLANDIGDNEDTLEHLPASVRASRLSAPRTGDFITWRSTTAPIIPLEFNVGNYVLPLWHVTPGQLIDFDMDFYVSLINTPEHLALSVNGKSALPIPLGGGGLRIPAGTFNVDDRGFVTLNLLNPDRQEVRLDLIALGLSQTP